MRMRRHRDGAGLAGRSSGQEVSNSSEGVCVWLTPYRWCSSYSLGKRCGDEDQRAENLYCCALS